MSPGDLELDYVPTQYLAEFFREIGFDGVQYRSALGAGSNVLLFRIGEVVFESSLVVKVTQGQWSYQELSSGAANMKAGGKDVE